MGTAWTVSIVVSIIIVVVHFNWFLVVGPLVADQLQQVRNAHGVGRGAGILEDQQQAGPTGQVSLRGVPPSVVAALVKAAR